MINIYVVHKKPNRLAVFERAAHQGSIQFDPRLLILKWLRDAGNESQHFVNLVDNIVITIDLLW